MTRLNPFGVALVVSTALHLSMVTLFSIVVYVPRFPAQFSRVELVSAGEPVRAEGWSLPPLARSLTASSEEALPPIDLPTLSLPIVDPALDAGRLADLESRAPIARREPDSWARFGQEIGALRERIGEIGAFVGLETQARAVTPVARVDSGVTASIEWPQGAEARELVIKPTIGVLWDIRLADPVLPLSISFSINARGQVTDVLAPPEDERGITRRVVSALRRFQFAPDTGDASLERQATLVIAVERAEP